MIIKSVIACPPSRGAGGSHFFLNNSLDCRKPYEICLRTEIIFFYVKGVVVNILIKRVAVIVSFFTIGGVCQAAHPAPQVTISTIADALSYLRRVTSNFSEDVAAEHVYKKVQSGALVKCAKVLYDNAYAQILAALQEIDARIKYWQDQRNHQWRYFLTKSPLKWVTGKSQKEEIENNLEQLQSHQGELYVLLGQLAQLGNVYDHQRKTVFVQDYEKGYAWIDELLDLLPRIKVDTQDSDESSPFITRVMLLRLKLGKVRRFKNDILSEMSDTQIPVHFERNWLKYGALMFGLGYGYKNISFDQLQAAFESLKVNVYDPIMMPVKRSINVLFPENTTKQKVSVMLPSLANTKNVSLDEAKQFVIDMSKKYGLGEPRIINDGMDKGDYKEFLKFLGNIAKKEKLDPSKMSVLQPTASIQSVIEWLASQSDYAHGLIDFFLLFGVSIGEDVLKLILDAIEAEQKQFKGVRDLVLLTPAAFVSWLGYSSYKKFTIKEYSQIRRALVDINSLFVDQTRPLDDERYGKMIYLVHNLKQRAEKEVPLNVRADFIGDLEMIELQEYDVAAKRRIVEDMFRKYSFLGVAH